MKPSEAKPKKSLSGRTKPLEIRDAIGKTRGESRSGTELSAVLRGPKKASTFGAQRKRPKADAVGRDVAEYATVLAHAVDTFGSRINANAWLNRPNRIFSNKSPLQILTQDPAAVEEELVRIDHGIFL